MSVTEISSRRFAIIAGPGRRFIRLIQLGGLDSLGGLKGVVSREFTRGTVRYDFVEVRSLEHLGDGGFASAFVTPGHTWGKVVHDSIWEMSIQIQIFAFILDSVASRLASTFLPTHLLRNGRYYLPSQ